MNYIYFVVYFVISKVFLYQIQTYTKTFGVELKKLVNIDILKADNFSQTFIKILYNSRKAN